MIISMRMHNIALIADLTLEFGDGLHVMTGETGDNLRCIEVVAERFNETNDKNIHVSVLCFIRIIHDRIAVRTDRIVHILFLHDSDLIRSAALRAGHVLMLSHERRSHGTGRNDEHFRKKRPKQKRYDKRNGDRFKDLAHHPAETLLLSLIFRTRFSRRNTFAQIRLDRSGNCRRFRTGCTHFLCRHGTPE